MEEAPVVVRKRVRVKKAPVDLPADDPPKEVVDEPPKEAEVRIKPIKPPRKRKPAIREEQKKEDDPSVVAVPDGAPADLQPTAAPPVEPPAVAAPPEKIEERPPEGVDTDPPFVEVKKKRGPYKKKPKGEPKNNGAVGAVGAGQIVDPQFWVGLDNTLKTLRRQAKTDRYSAFVIA